MAAAVVVLSMREMWWTESALTKLAMAAREAKIEGWSVEEKK